MNDVLRRRRRERAQLIEQAGEFSRELDRRIGLELAIVTGSVARGDFNVWSDVDLLVVSNNLKSRAPDRNLQLNINAPVGFQVIGMTPSERDTARRRKNRLVLEAEQGGVVVFPEDDTRPGSKPPAAAEP